MKVEWMDVMWDVLMVECLVVRWVVLSVDKRVLMKDATMVVCWVVR